MASLFLLVGALALVGLALGAGANLERRIDRAESAIVFRAVLRPGVDGAGAEGLARALEMVYEWRQVRPVAPRERLQGVPGLEGWLADPANAAILDRLPWSLDLHPAGALRRTVAVLAAGEALGKRAEVAEVFQDAAGVRRLRSRFEGWGQVVGLAQALALAVAVAVVFPARALRRPRRGAGRLAETLCPAAGLVAAGCVWLAQWLLAVCTDWEPVFLTTGQLLFLMTLGGVLGGAAVWKDPARTVVGALAAVGLALCAAAPGALAAGADSDGRLFAERAAPTDAERRDAEGMRRVSAARRDLLERKCALLARAAESSEAAAAALCARLDGRPSGCGDSAEALSQATGQATVRCLLAAAIRGAGEASSRERARFVQCKADLEGLVADSRRPAWADRLDGLTATARRWEGRWPLGEWALRGIRTGRLPEGGTALLAGMFRHPRVPPAGLREQAAASPAAVSAAATPESPSLRADANLRQEHVLDVGLPAGGSVHAVAAGTVLFAGDFRGMGTMVVLGHADDCSSVYGFLESAAVKAGRAVRRGDVLGAAGRPPRGAGTGVRFEMRKNGGLVDPAVLPGLSLQNLGDRLRGGSPPVAHKE